MITVIFYKTSCFNNYNKQYIFHYYGLPWWFFNIAYLKKKTKMIHTAVFGENIWNLLPSIFRRPGSTSCRPNRVGTSWSSSFFGILGTHGLKSYPYNSRLRLGINFRPLHHTKWGGFSQQHTATTYSYHTHFTNEPDRVHLN